MISAILLAAGESQRMGEPKLLLPFGNSTILEQTVDNLLGSRVDEVIVVAGYKAQEVRKRLANRPVRIVLNPAYHQGMGSSIVKGLSLVDRNRRAVMLVLADQPLIDSETINKLIEAFSSQTKGIVVPVYQGRRGHPVIFAAKYIGALQGLTGDVGGRQIIGENEDDILEVVIHSKGIDIDIDTIDDYHSLID